MRITNIQFTNFKCFKDQKIDLGRINLLYGSVGCGKTSIIEGLEYCLWGKIKKRNLEQLITKGSGAEGFSVTCGVEYQGFNYTIKRCYPTKLEVWRNGEKFKFNTTAEGNKYLEDLFGNYDNHRKFHTLHPYDSEINFLEDGATAIKKILFSQSDTFFNGVRDKLLGIKGEREKYSRDNLSLIKHYPSQKRVDILESGITNLKKSYNELNTTLKKMEGEYRDIQNDIKTTQREMKDIELQAKKLKEENKEIEQNICYVCKQVVGVEKKEALIEERKNKIAQLRAKYITLQEELPKFENMLLGLPESIEKEKNKITKIVDRREKLAVKKSQLVERLGQTKYKYTNKDILVSKKAIETWDNISTQYLIIKLGELTPIINQVLEKVGFEIHFDTDKSGKFEIRLTKDGEIYTFVELSTGQRLLLQLSLKLALLLGQGDTESILVADEGFSCLSENVLKEVIELLNSLDYQPFMVIHRFEDKLDCLTLVDVEQVRNG